MQTLLQQNLSKVLQTIVKASETTNKQVTLVAVSKTKPVELIKEAYEGGQKHFGENYVNEVIEKAPLLPNDISWHFIGHLQTNKVSTLMKIQNLEFIQSVDSLKLAQKIEKHCEKLGRNINVFVQIKLSEEESKTGAEIDEAKLIIQEIITKFKFIKLIGLMTIGPIGNKEIFEQLVDLAKKFENEFNLQPLKLSMGMSGDYLDAIKYGADYVRVGSAIFGERNVQQ
ncbi:unnamed protein product [Paramecium octaurelia]|uniref:Pyridoxal phosphate homeostasis protein n=1 Tax=Paramecium octaurelia TaxID=43137 RepID=A0A8S1U4Z8_PAROT|nr:unnamed protein product [Paramecium octaurelia]